ncbi:MAG: TMEM165/GDT1 family protein [bacterium]|nr:TMEM165/GDT1 family protein [bacterium]
MVQAILLPFTTILLAEFLDKSQVALLLLSTKSKHHLQLLLGALLAFALVDGTAIFLGSLVTGLIPALYIKILAAITFFYFGISSLRMSQDDGKTVHTGKSAFVSALSVIFLSEWGDKTQIVSAVFAARLNPLFVFIGVMSAMLVLSISAIYIGTQLGKRAQAEKIHKVAGLLFLLLGVGFLLF